MGDSPRAEATVQKFVSLVSLGSLQSIRGKHEIGTDLYNSGLTFWSYQNDIYTFQW